MKQEETHIKALIDSWYRERPDLELTNVLLGICLRRLGRVLEQVYDKMCRERFHINGADMRVLFALRRAGPPFARSPTNLYNSLLVTSGAITKQVDRLNKLGLVKRLPNPSYGGGLLIQLTRKGLKVADEAIEIQADESILEVATSPLSKSDKKHMLRLCKILLENIELNNGMDNMGQAKSATRKSGAKKTK